MTPTPTTPPSTDALPLRMLDGEALYTVCGGLKPVSEGFRQTAFPTSQTGSAPVDAVRLALATLPLGLDLEADGRTDPDDVLVLAGGVRRAGQTGGGRSARRQADTRGGVPAVLLSCLPPALSGEGVGTPPAMPRPVKPVTAILPNRVAGGGVLSYCV
jgi:hypothetical protein